MTNYKFGKKKAKFFLMKNQRKLGNTGNFNGELKFKQRELKSFQLNSEGQEIDDRQKQNKNLTPRTKVFKIFPFIMNGDKFQENTAGGNRNWTDDLPICEFTGCGYSINQMYLRDGRIATESHYDYEKKLFCCYDSKK